MSTYYITYTDSKDATCIYGGIYPTVRKAKNVVKWMLERPVATFRNIIIWEGCPGGIRVETHRPVTA